jgi:hypothetical protein
MSDQIECRCVSGAHTCGAPNDDEERYVKWAAETEGQLDGALAALRDPGAPSDDVLAAIGLADLAYRIAVNEAPEEEWPEEYEPECICPPELLARGGFKGGCPVHA